MERELIKLRDAYDIKSFVTNNEVKKELYCEFSKQLTQIIESQKEPIRNLCCNDKECPRGGTSLPNKEYCKGCTYYY